MEKKQESRCSRCGATQDEAIKRDERWFSFNSSVCSRYDCDPKKKFNCEQHNT